MKRFVIVFALALMACHRANAEDAADQNAFRALDQIESVEARDQREVGELRASATDLRQQAAFLTRTWITVSTAFDAASADYERAITVGRAAAGDFEKARGNYEQAGEHFRAAATILILAAASEAFGGDACGQMMSTQKFRAKLRAEGVSVDGLDVDHIWPRSLGGADDVRNYQLLDSSLNRSLGAGVMTKLAAAPLTLLRGLATSAIDALRCG